MKKILHQKVDTAEDVSQLTADLVDVLDAGKRTVSDIITTTRVFKSIPKIRPKDEEEFRTLAQVNGFWGGGGTIVDPPARQQNGDINW